jgi:hypothetical protein
LLSLLGFACHHRLPLGGSDAGPGDAGGGPPGDLGQPDAPQPSSCAYSLLAGPTTVNSTLAGQDLSPSLVHTGSRFAVTWSHSLPNLHPVVQLRLALEDTTVVGSLATVGPESHTWAELAASGSGLGLCWMTDPGMTGRVAFRLLSNSGAPRGAPVDVSFDYPSACTALVARPGGWAATVSGLYTTPDGGHDYRHALVRLDSAGRPLGAAQQFCDASAGSNRLSLVHTGDGYLAGFITPNGGGGATVRVQRFDQQGRRVGSARSLTPESGTAVRPQLIWTGGQALALYLREEINGDRRVMLQPLSAAGQARGQPIQITDSGWVERISAGWSGTEVALAWIRLPPGSFPGPIPPSPALVMLTRLRPGGARLQPDLELARLAGVMIYRVAVAGTPHKLGVTWDEHRGTGDTIRLAVAGCRR